MDRWTQLKNRSLLLRTTHCRHTIEVAGLIGNQSAAPVCVRRRGKVIDRVLNPGGPGSARRRSHSENQAAVSVGAVLQSSLGRAIEDALGPNNSPLWITTVIPAREVVQRAERPN